MPVPLVLVAYPFINNLNAHNSSSNRNIRDEFRTIRLTHYDVNRYEGASRLFVGKTGF
jgi:hypothetical protein